MQILLAAILAAGVLAAPGKDLASGRQHDFMAAAREFGVPVSVLLGVSYLGSRWDTHGGSPSTAGGYGPMHLVDAIPAGSSVIGDALGDARGDDARPMPPRPATVPPSTALRTAQAAPRTTQAAPRTAQAAPRTAQAAPRTAQAAPRTAQAAPRTTLPEAGRLIGVEPARLRTDPSANIRAGAALLASYQNRPSTDPSDWYGAIARYSGAQDSMAAREFADEVFAVIREGMQRRTDDGHVVRLDPVPSLRAGMESKSSADDPQPAEGTAPPAGIITQAAEATAPPAAGTTQPAADTAPPAAGTTHPAEVGTQQVGGVAPAGGVAGAQPSAEGQVYGVDGQAVPGENGPGDGLPSTNSAPLSQGWYAEEAEPPVERAATTECPASLACEWMPAAYQRFGKKNNKDYGNHDRMLRPRSVDYIVIHDTEGTYQGIPSMIGNPKYVSWHYTIRSRDGHVAQHVATRDIAWHAGNWDVNTRSIGIEHEGYLAKGGTWYTEAMYRASAKLVRYLADKYGIPLDRAHILGHDNVPGTTPKSVAGMHADPGPYWDWAHYFELMGRPLTAVKGGDSVMIRPSYDSNRPRFTGCLASKSVPGLAAKAGQDCPPHGASTVWLHAAPSASAPLVTDVGKHGGKPSSYSVYDHAARASTGQRFAVAERRGDWTAIWYLGQKAWFHNPAANPTAVPAKGSLVTPLKPNTKVYGRAYPEKSAYTAGIASYQPLTPLQYTISPGQTYTVGDTITGSYYAAGAFHPSKHVTTTGKTRYHQIQLGHRVMFVMTKDVRLIP
ncbi:N-acetylmuramoyl-L-alanine amidase [Nonomuraea polychroma]|uniref:N-acetylmuramoyl-L-alanine amidase n=1 Tax=Nonomuraea polychroma TaxID=46176 RepID=A0A438MAI0_9ACTN|nr:N-acetylmuramoyl-L-alanine amidase [Nonomuraea polychroma]RVX42740.1 N-acetylmuramoyl-L-alanine amidase [Nonomuraea polychroma]